MYDFHLLACLTIVQSIQVLYFFYIRYFCMLLCMFFFVLGIFNIRYFFIFIFNIRYLFIFIFNFLFSI